ncbi:MAG: hypothetical protein IT446_06545 [Phycisphaerales bacterium]|nr:hypothetical protein [Phycisphaerales bacterium]
MADLLRTGSNWLERMRTEHAASEVEYHRPPDAKVVLATFGRTEYELENESGLRTGAMAADFLILADDVASPFGHPRPGDWIVADGRRYEVMNLGSGGCWRYSDPFRQTCRIHTKEIGADV